jgi:hypothetical protein
MFFTLGYKYGPLLIASYAPMLALVGPPGILITHVVVLLALCAVFLFGYSNPRERAGAALLLLPVLAPYVVRRESAF